MKLVKEITKVLVWGMLLNILVLQGQTKANDKNQLDPSIRHGTLENGFTYYIKNIVNSNTKLSMHFYVKVGSYHNNTHELDFPHAIEHLAFRCARHFKKNILNDSELIARLGMEKGDVFAQTSHLYTRYSFNIPPFRKDALDTGFLFFHDIANGLEFDEEDVNSERGPLRQELIYRSGDNLENFFLEQNLESKLFPCKQDFTQFFEHNKAFSSESLAAFYKNWYRPELMSLVIVGNVVDIDQLETKIRRRFSDIPPSQFPIQKGNCYEDYFKGSNQFLVMKREPHQVPDPNVDYVKIQLYQRDKKVFDTTNQNASFKREILWSLFSKMLNKRFAQFNENYITQYGAYAFPPTQIFPAFRIKIGAQEKQKQEAIINTIRTLEQIRKYGFTQKEWQASKKEYLKIVQRENDTTQISYWMEQIRDYYIYNKAVPKHKASSLNQWFIDLSLKEFNTIIHSYASFNPDDIAVIVPLLGEDLTYSEKEMRKWINLSREEPISPYILPKTPEQIISNKELSNLKKLDYIDKGKDESGARKLILSNGVKVVLKAFTPPKGRLNDRILLHGFNTRGASCFPEQDYFSAINVPNIIRTAGIKEMNKFTLDRFLQQTSFSQGMHLYVENNESGIKGNATLEDFEKMLQLVYLYFTNPRKDPMAFQYWKRKERQRHISPSYNDLIQEDFNVKIRQFLGDRSNVPEGTLRLKGIEKTELNSTYEIFKNLFGNSKNFTFLITGDFSSKEIIPLLQKYLGNLPTDSTLSTCQLSEFSKVEAHNSPLYHEFLAKDMGTHYDMKSEKYSMRFIIKTDSTHNWKEDIKVQLLGLLIHSKIQGLRFSKDASLYQMGAFGRFNQYHKSYEVGLLLDCVPDEVEGLRNECKNMIEQVKLNCFNNERFQIVLDRFIKSKYNSKHIRNNQQMIQSMHEYYRFNNSWVSSAEKERFVRSLTPKEIQKTAQKYLKAENRMEFIFK